MIYQLIKQALEVVEADTNLQDITKEDNLLHFLLRELALYDFRLHPLFLH